MKCKFCGSENTKDVSVTYIGDAKEIHRHALAECLDCKLQFGYTAITEIPKIISAEYSKVNEEELFYLMSRGLTEAEATEMIVMGFIEPFSRELPMEYAVELNRLIKLEMVDSIG